MTMVCSPPTAAARRSDREWQQWVISGGTDPSAARQLNLDKRTLTPRTRAGRFGAEVKTFRDSVDQPNQWVIVP
jgi:hypothetical protein